MWGGNIQAERMWSIIRREKNPGKRSDHNSKARKLEDRGGQQGQQETGEE